MAVGRISKTTVEAMPVPASGEARVYLWDDKIKGFGCMVGSSGSRTYLMQYRIGGRGNPTRRYTIGRHGSITAEQARKRAEELSADIIRRIDPLASEREAKAEAQARNAAEAKAQQDAERLAFDTYADLFVERHAKARKLRSAGEIEAVLVRDLKPHFGSTPLPKIKRTDIRAALDTLEERSPSAANKAHKWLRKLFVWAVQRGDIEASPMAAMPAPAPENRRTRVLSDDEIKAAWEASHALGHPFGPIVRLLILTGQRLREVAGLDWAEVNLKHRVWVIPAARTKNERDHLVPLSADAVEILEAQFKLIPDADKDTEQPKTGLVFSSTGKTPVSGFSKSKARLDSLIAKGEAKAAVEAGRDPVAMPKWVLHDLRRTFATGCQRLGIALEHTEAVLNHISGTRGGIVGVYQLHGYEREKRRALEAWADHVAEVLGRRSLTSNVEDINAHRRA